MLDWGQERGMRSQVLSTDAKRAPEQSLGKSLASAALVAANLGPGLGVW